MPVENGEAVLASLPLIPVLHPDELTVDGHRPDQVDSFGDVAVNGYRTMRCYYPGGAVRLWVHKPDELGWVEAEEFRVHRPPLGDGSGLGEPTIAITPAARAAE